MEMETVTVTEMEMETVMETVMVMEESLFLNVETPDLSQVMVKDAMMETY